jgi:hypothetical protein
MQCFLTLKLAVRGTVTVVSRMGKTTPCRGLDRPLNVQ